jgi:hypothetical protein
MKLAQIQVIARDKGVAPGKLTKTDLIHAIQRQEGAFDCYGTAYAGVCDQLACLWREDCFKIARKNPN